jgi:hypothetical protein
MDRQSEAYRRMTDEDIVEEIPDSIHHPPCTSLRGINLPEDYPEPEGQPKNLILAEVALHDRIMDPSAPDDHKVQGTYVRMSHRREDEDSS